jgi:hypothetical protein
MTNRKSIFELVTFDFSRMGKSSHIHTLTSNLQIVFPSPSNAKKREDKHNTVTQEPLGDLVLCPMRFAAGFVRRIWSYKGTDSSTRISTYISNGIIEHAASTWVIDALCKMVGAIGEPT